MRTKINKTNCTRSMKYSALWICKRERGENSNVGWYCEDKFVNLFYNNIDDQGK